VELTKPSRGRRGARTSDHRPPQKKHEGPRASTRSHSPAAAPRPPEYLTRESYIYFARASGSPRLAIATTPTIPSLLPRTGLVFFLPIRLLFSFFRCCKISCWRGPRPEDSSDPYPSRISRLASATRSAPPQLSTSSGFFSPDPIFASAPSAHRARLLPWFLFHHSSSPLVPFREGVPPL
jgi:hypothetical protein